MGALLRGMRAQAESAPTKRGVLINGRHVSESPIVPILNEKH